MTTPPLDLPALREHVTDAERLGTNADVTNDDVLALLDELDKAKRACQTMGRIIDQQCKDALTATDSQDLLWGNDGDGDWGAIWERVLGLGEKAREATDRAEAAEREASEWERSFNAERADKYMADDAAKAWRLRAEAAEKAVERVEALCQDTDGNWLDPEDECNNVGGILQAVRGVGCRTAPGIVFNTNQPPYRTLTTEPLASTHHTPETETL